MSTRAEILQKRREAGLPHWKPSQRRRLTECIKAGCTIAYWNSDAWGRSANNGNTEIEPARAGVVHTCKGPLQLCGPGALHATMTPHKWRGTRVWVVALHGEVKSQDDKVGALKREILGEVLPNESWISPSVCVRIRSSGHADLRGADLRGADLYGADLRGANLYGANLYGADLRGWERSDDGFARRKQ
jgi:hypothetical protein